MAVHQKLSEIGWFYHAPEKRRTHEPIALPLASQIPGLNDFSELPEEEPPRTMFRDTDTKYIRLAKMGGREDLLRFREPNPKPKEPTPYPRNEWFYLEDNRIEQDESEPKQPWEFRLPEYMVHDEFKPFGDGYDYKNDPEHKMYWKYNKNKKSPLYGDGAHFYERDGASQQNVQNTKIPESKSGYRATENRQRSREIQQKQSLRQQEDAATRYPPLPPMYDQSARPAMNKLLAYGYATEWTKARDDWYYQIGDVHNKESRGREENKDMFAARKSGGNKKAHNLTTWNDLTGKNTATSAHHNNTPKLKSSEENKKPFKLSKFANVGPRIDTNKQLPPISSTKAQ